MILIGRLLKSAFPSGEKNIYENSTYRGIKTKKCRKYLITKKLEYSPLHKAFEMQNETKM